MLKVLLTTAMAVSSLCLSAQQAIRGYVKDAKTQAPLPGATVVLLAGQSATGSAVTEPSGYFLISVPTGQKYQAEIRFVGYKTQTVELQASADKSTTDVLLDEDVIITDEVIVMSTRATDKSAATYSTIDKLTLQKQNFGQDLPIVLNWSPSLVTTSDAGAGVGYTGLRIRGSDATRINVTINGIPYNDSESQGTFWVDVPDIATSTQSIQVQRGVGTSTNGAGAFGASINLQTNTRNEKAYADVLNSAGSFGTHRHTIGFGSGLINKKFVFDGRLSMIKSDGFVDRASSNLKSYYLSGGYYGDRTIVKGIVFGGQEITYQSWNGVPESRLNNDVNAMLITAGAEGWNQAQTDNLLNSNRRTFNAYTYKDQVDNYTQNHNQLHVSHRISDNLTASLSGHYTHGFGYYEEYRYDEKFSAYGLSSPVIGGQPVNRSDFIRRRWLDNDFYGATWSLNYETSNLMSVFGGGWNRYKGDHFGEITWTSVAAGIPKDYRYYFNDATKDDFNAYWKNTWSFTPKISAFVDLQYRNVGYKTAGVENKQNSFDISKTYHFFNPKVGLTYAVAQGQEVYGSYSIGNREPVRDDLVNAPFGTDPKAERLEDLELGWRYRKASYSLNVNYYFMNYRNQLVLTGALSDTGASLRTNVDNSYRTGVEIEFASKIGTDFSYGFNVTLSQNKIKNFGEVLYDYGANYDEYNEVIRTYSNTDIAFSPSTIAGGIFSYKPVKGLEVSWLAKYVGKQYLDNTSNDARKIGSYFTNDIRFIYSIYPRSMREITLSLLANNIFDVEYQSNGYTYGYLAGPDEIRQNYFYPQAGRNYMVMLALRF